MAYPACRTPSDGKREAQTVCKALVAVVPLTRCSEVIQDVHVFIDAQLVVKVTAIA